MNKKIEPKKLPQVTADNYLAALDIGSNSFHFVLARQIDGQVQIIHTEKYRVQLAQGLAANNILSQESINRALLTLEKLATTTQHINKKSFRAVATFTLRQANNASEFLKAAAKVFPFDIEIISGHEEARLIYQGVAHHRQHNNQQLVIDIGGGSTECIIGQQYQIKALDSINIGCVSYQQQFFTDGEINDKAFKKAINAAKHQVDSIAQRFKKVGWQSVIGTSGTIKAITKIIHFQQETPQTINKKQLHNLKRQLIQFKDVNLLDIKGLKENRRNVICSGLAILIAVMETLEIEHIEYCKYALREGVLFEQNENLQHNSVKHNTINSLIKRFNIDSLQVKTVETIAVKIFNQVKESWQLTEPVYYELLSFAIKLHELGLNINSSGYHKHGQYIIEQADLPGFNQEQQTALAWLIGNQRKKVTEIDNNQWLLLSSDALNKLCLLVRLTVLLNQQRHTDTSYLLDITSNKKSLSLLFNQQWLLERPIIDTELFYLQQTSLELGVKLKIKSQAL